LSEDGVTLSLDPAVSMEDVARRAGVSTATVSRTLRGLPNVSAATRGRVLKAAAELSYAISPIASRLASGRTHSVAVLVPYASRWFFAQVVAGVEGVLREEGLDLLLYNLADHEARERFFQRLPLRRRVDAVLPVAMPLTDAETGALRGLGVPLAVAGHRADGVHSVRIDDTATVHIALRHLLDLGHRRIGLISTYANQKMWLPVADERRRAWQSGLAAAGVAPAPELVVSVPFGHAGGASGAERLLARPDPPTAILCESDELAFGVLAALRRAGVDVPGQVSVVGIDDHELAEVFDLTTVRQAVPEQGALAARMLVRAMREARRPPSEVVVPTELVVRTSTGPAR